MSGLCKFIIDSLQLIKLYFFNISLFIHSFGLGNNSYALGQGFTSTINSSEATNDFFGTFNSPGFGIELNLNPSNFGGSKKNLPPVFVHAYLMFVFPG